MTELAPQFLQPAGAVLPPPVVIPVLPLPSGGVVEFLQTSAVTERSRRPIRVAMARFSPEAHETMRVAEQSGAALAPTDFSPEEQELMYEINDLVAVAVIKSASFLAEGERCTVDHVRDLPSADYDALIAAISPMMGSLMSGVDFDPTPDPASPTAPSSE